MSSVLPILDAIRLGNHTTATIAAATGLDARKVGASLLGLSRGKSPAVESVGHASNGKGGRHGAMVAVYALTRAGLARLRAPESAAEPGVLPAAVAAPEPKRKKGGRMAQASLFDPEA